ncbi:DUF2262 domain-containing protein [Chryseobacterium gregarium]|uniref:DUF2262 domain-containing protein n=1 Tax=Chryseobacterium gregarium TaxID=456299 RepID=UPI0004054883|nr:DUF2262 domain-containing protein [Chryseobacterium gregarium]
MEATWDIKLMDLLKNARLESPKEMSLFLEKHSPLAVANEDYSVLLLFRNFMVQHWNDERRILNCHPEDNRFQCGITIVRSSDDFNSESNVYLPNHLNYRALKITGQEIEIITDEKIITTNITELFRKLKFFKFSVTEQEIENAFSTLCNEPYELPEKPEVKSTTIKIPSVGELVYNEKLEWYEGKFNTGKQNIDISVYNTEPNELKELISFVDRQMNSKFYEEMLLEMESEMIELKNEVWLGQDEETGEDEPPITAENFRKRISVSSIVFYDDGSSSVYCNDGDIFWGHLIDISMDKNGTYKEVSLLG